MYYKLRRYLFGYLDSCLLCLYEFLIAINNVVNKHLNAPIMYNNCNNEPK